MAGRNVPVVLIPRFTTYIGVQQFDHLPIPVAAYEQLVTSVWVGPVMGVAPTLGLLFQESNDLSSWTSCSGSAWITPGAGVEVQLTFGLTKAWFRLSLTLAGGGAPAVTGWAEGFLVLREK